METKREKRRSSPGMGEYRIRDINLLIGDQTVTISGDQFATNDSGKVELTAQLVSDEDSDTDNEIEVNISAIRHKEYLNSRSDTLPDSGRCSFDNNGQFSNDFLNKVNPTGGTTLVTQNVAQSSAIPGDIKSSATQCGIQAKSQGTQSENATKSMSVQSENVDKESQATQSDGVKTGNQGTQCENIPFNSNHSQTDRSETPNMVESSSNKIEVEHITIPIEIRLPPSKYLGDMENHDTDIDSGFHDNGGSQDGDKEGTLSEKKRRRLDKLARAQRLLQELKEKENPPNLIQTPDRKANSPEVSKDGGEQKSHGHEMSTGNAKKGEPRNEEFFPKRSVEEDIQSLSFNGKSTANDPDEFDDDFDEYDNSVSPRGRGMRPVEDFNRFELMPKDKSKPSNPVNREPHKKFSKRGKLAKFFRNGDPHFKGLPVSVSQKCFVTYKTLLEWLNEKITTTAGVRHIFSWPEGREIKDVTEFVGGRSYIVSSTKKLNRDIDYGYESKEKFWATTKASAGRLRKGEKHLYVDSLDSPPGSAKAQPRVLTIISNTNRDSREKVMLNPMTSQTFEEMLRDIQSMVLIDSPPVRALYAAKHPYKRVSSFSQLFNDFKNQDTFLACGEERQPMELSTPKRPIQSSNSSNDSALNTFSMRKPKKKPKKNKSEVAMMDIDTTDSFLSEKAPPALIKQKEKLSPPTKRVSPRRQPQVPQTSRSLSPQPVGRRHPGRFRNVPDISPRSASPRPSPSPKPVSITPAKPPPPRRFLPRRQTKPIEVVRVDIHGNRREFYSPSYQDKITTEKPAKKLKLDWVYGYRGRDAKSNLYVLPSSETMYYVASVVVIYNKLRETQRLYTGHNEDISSMALHPNGFYVATGQFAGDNADTSAHVRIWDSKSLQTYAILGLGVFQGGLSSLNFSIQSEGDYLVAIDDDEKHTMSVWRWSEEKVIAKTVLTQDKDFAHIAADDLTVSPREHDDKSTTNETVVWCDFHPDDDSIILTYGKHHLYFWKIFTEGKRGEEVKILRDKKSGIYPGPVPQYVTSVAFAYNGDVISGDSNGAITVWRRGMDDSFSIDQSASEYMQHAHKKSVFALCMMDDGTLLSGGGHEVRAWDTVNGYRHVKERLIPESAGYVRSLAPQSTATGDSQLYVGTTKNAILEGNIHNKFKMLIQGHCEEVWAMAAYPEEHAFVTAGYDRHVCKWSTVSRRLQWRVHVEKPCLCADVNTKGRLIAVGTTVGLFIILSGHDGSHVTTVQAGTDGITVIKFSPDGSMLAMGTQNGSIYVYHVMENGQFYRRHKEGIQRGHNNFVMQLDWSYDGRSLQSVSGDYDLLYWHVESMTQEKQAREMKDIDWYTQTCSLGYNLLGAWSHLGEEEDIDTVARSNYQNYLAVGNNKGAIRLYRYPCTAHKPDYYEKKHYSSHVTNIQFMFDDSFVISSGGVDAGILQWSLVDPMTPR